MLALGTNTLIPGFEEQLVGMNKGETRKIKVTFPEDYSNKDLAGKDANFTVTLKEIKKKVLPELNDEFAKDIGGNKSVDELKAGIKKDLEARKRDEQASAQREELLSKLIDSPSLRCTAGHGGTRTSVHVRTAGNPHGAAGDGCQILRCGEVPRRTQNPGRKARQGCPVLDMIADKEKVEVSDSEVNVGHCGNGPVSKADRGGRQEILRIRRRRTRKPPVLAGAGKDPGLLLSKAKKSYN